MVSCIMDPTSENKDELFLLTAVKVSLECTCQKQMQKQKTFESKSLPFCLTFEMTCVNWPKACFPPIDIESVLKSVMCLSVLKSTMCLPRVSGSQLKKKLGYVTCCEFNCRLQSIVWLSLEEFLLFCCTKSHSMTKQAPLLKAAKVQLPEWWVTQRLYCNMYDRTTAPSMYRWEKTVSACLLPSLTKYWENLTVSTWGGGGGMAATKTWRRQWCSSCLLVRGLQI